jgi:hypothetical protein
MCICKLFRFLYNKKRHQNVNKSFQIFEIVIPTNLQENNKTITSTNRTYGECCICLEQLDKDLYALPCAHLFHEKCIRLWLKNHTKCPICENIV